MFETSVVKERVAPQRRAGVFAASIAAHTVVIAGVVVASITNVSFPKAAPLETLPLIMIAPVPDPPPLPRGNPNAPREPQPPQQHPAQAQQQTAPPQVTTPLTIPDSIPVAQTSTATDVGPSTGTNTSTSGERWGDPNGDPNGVDVGQMPNSNTAGVPDVIYQPGADVKPATILFRVQPVYPRAGMAARLNGWVAVRCIIGKDGQLRDVAVEKSSMQMFEQPAIDALRQWKFAPGYYHGQAVDTYFELKVTFQVR